MKLKKTPAVEFYNKIPQIKRKRKFIYDVIHTSVLKPVRSNATGQKIPFHFISTNKKAARHSQLRLVKQL